MLIIDYSAVAIAAILALREEFSDDPKDMENLGRHAILSAIKGYKLKYPEYSSEVIIACDGSKYWRKDIFPNYKANRKKAKEASDIPWGEIHRIMDMVVAELDKYFKYRVIKHDKLEADDVIAIFVREIANKREVIELLGDPEPESVMIISGDGDLKQLHSKTVKQFSPVMKVLVKLDQGQSARDFIRKKILTGDTGDGVPNVFSGIDDLVNGIRQKAARETKMQPLLEHDDMTAGTDDINIKERIRMNEMLVSFDKIPEKYTQEVLDMYNSPRKTPTKMDAYMYLIKKGCNILAEDIDKF